MTTTGSTRLLTLSCTTTCYLSVVCSLFLFFPSLILWNHLLIKEPNKDLRACIYSSIFTYDIKNWQKDKDVKQLSTFQLIQIESEQHKRVWATQEDDACSHQNKFMPSHTTIPIEPQSQALSIPRWKKGRTTWWHNASNALTLLTPQKMASICSTKIPTSLPNSLAHQCLLINPDFSFILSFSTSPDYTLF